MAFPASSSGLSLRFGRTTPVLHAAALRAWGKRLVWTWPRDGRRETLEGAGISLAKQYTAAGLTMTRTHANIDDGTPGGSVSVEAGLMDMRAASLGLATSP
jgi:hypothetical protein